MTFGNSNDESQRDSGSKPKVARSVPPWESRTHDHTPNGVVAWWANRDATPLGLKFSTTTTQGSSRLATLGWGTQSLWDCRSRQLDRTAAQPFIQLALPNAIEADTAFNADS